MCISGERKILGFQEKFTGRGPSSPLNFAIAAAQSRMERREIGCIYLLTIFEIWIDFFVQT